MNSEGDISPILEFYLGAQGDSQGRMIEEIWQWDSDQLERVHDYIQWLFPLKERSHFNPRAPTLNQADIKAFQISDELRHRLGCSLKLMLRFYGFDLLESEQQIRIKPSNDFSNRSMNWLNPDNHNHLRLTRILICLNILGFQSYASS